MPRTKQISDEEILHVFKESEDAFLTAGEIADTFGYTNQGIIKRLNDLHDRGLVERKEAGGRAVGWWLKN